MMRIRYTCVTSNAEIDTNYNICMHMSRVMPYVGCMMEDYMSHMSHTINLTYVCVSRRISNQHPLKIKT